MYQQGFEQQKTQFVDAQAEILRTDVPDWGPAKRDEAFEVVKSFGFEDAEIDGGMLDARLMKAALEVKSLREKVAAFEQAAEQGREAAARVKRKPPVTLKPGARKAAPDAAAIRRRNISTAKRRLGQTKSLKDAAAAVELQLFS